MRQPGRLAVITSHPVQYYAPLFIELHRRLTLQVFYGHRAGPDDQAQAGFGVEFEWDTDLLSGYPSQFLTNRAKRPGLSQFAGIDTPDIRDRLRDGKFDAVMLIGWHKKFLLQALYAAKRLNLPVFVRGDSHLATPRSRFKKLAKQVVYPVFLHQFDAALVVGQRNDDYWRYYKYPEKRMFASPHCVDNAWFAQRATGAARAELRDQLGIDPATPVALFAGKLTENKHPQHLVEAAALVRATGIPLEVIVAGDGALQASLIENAARLRVPMHCLGFCNQSKMPAVYAAADLLVLTSENETWGLVANEALACGRPVIVSDTVGCAPDLASHLGQQAVYPFSSTPALASRIADMLLFPCDQNRIKQAAHAFSISRAADGILSAMHANMLDGTRK